MSARHTPFGFTLALGLALILGGSDTGARETGTAGAKPELPRRDTISIDFSLSPAEKDAGVTAHSQGVVSLRISDPRTGSPMGGLRPKAWLKAVSAEPTAATPTCQETIRSLSSGRLTSRADVDMNRYWLLTLNTDRTVTVINPQVAFTATKLESIIELPGVGADWVRSRNQRFVYVSMPDQSAVAVLDMASRKLLKSVPTGTDSRPTRMQLQPDGRYLWVGLEGSDAVAAIDTGTLAVTATLPAGKGPHTMVISPDNRTVYVSNATDDTVTAIDTAKLQSTASINTGKTPVAMDYGQASRMLYVAELNGGRIDVIDPQSLQVAARVATKPGIVALRFDPEGRFAFAVNQLDSTVTVIDSATHKPVGTTHVVKDPDQIMFTDRYAYIRGIGSEKFSLIELNAARKGLLSTVDIQAGRQPPEAEVNELGVAPMIVPTPEGNSAMIANAPDREVYYYQEGMMATMGTFSNYSRTPRSVMVLDQSLGESAPGVYEANVRLPPAGRYSLAVLIDQPRVAQCFDVPISSGGDAQSQAPESGSVVIEREGKDADVPVGVPYTFRFRLSDGSGNPLPGALRNASIVLVRPPGAWQTRGFLASTADGAYEWQTRLPETGSYKLVITIPSHKIRWADTASQNMKAVDPRGTTVASGKTPDHGR